MIVDGLKAAEPYKKIAKQIKDPRRYVYLTDDIMPEIERSQEPVSPNLNRMPKTATTLFKLGAF